MDDPTMECLEDGRDDDPCRGKIEMRMSLDSMKSWPRCEHHAKGWYERSEKNLELLSDTPASWFDPSYAGERWSEDDY